LNAFAELESQIDDDAINFDKFEVIRSSNKPLQGPGSTYGPGEPEQLVQQRAGILVLIYLGLFRCNVPCAVCQYPASFSEGMRPKARRLTEHNG